MKINDNYKIESAEGTYKIQVASFYIDKKLFGIPIEDVLEVNKNVDMTPVPLAPVYIEGVINLRGQIVTAINLRKRLEMADRIVDENSAQVKYHNIIIGSRSNSVSLLVDEIGDVLEITSDVIEPPPDTIKGLDPKYVKNVCKLKGELLVVLDSVKIQSEE
jgi:purine-binding chemotaxis protein CheW